MTAGSNQAREPQSLSTSLRTLIEREIEAAGGWLGFERFMELALYAPGLGYYMRAGERFGQLARDGSDFVTAPELSPLFGQALARQVGQVLQATATDTVVEFGAGSGALAEQLLDSLGSALRSYQIVDLSGALAARQRERLARFGERVRWLERWPEQIRGVALGNEVLDAMPVQLIAFDGKGWCERGVVRQGEGFAWADRPAAVQPPVDAGFGAGAVTELQRQAQAFVSGLAQRLQHGVALLIDYGFPEAEYYHPQRSTGTLLCHRAHRVDADPLAEVGSKDITAHIDFSAMALAAQRGGAQCLGYTSQGRFLLNCGLAELLAEAGTAARVAAHRLVAEHEMGELFKVLAFGRGCDVELIGFGAGDRSHRL